MKKEQYRRPASHIVELDTRGNYLQATSDVRVENESNDGTVPVMPWDD